MGPDRGDGMPPTPLLDATPLLDERRAPAPSALEPTRRNGYRSAIRIALVVASIAIWFVYTGGRSPWIELNLPGGIHGGNPASGYTSLYNGDFYHKENFYALQHIDLIKGNSESFQERIGSATGGCSTRSPETSSRFCSPRTTRCGSSIC
jgi:hypothetical protein